ncbi:MAG: DNA repair exonuclease [Clostridiales bacterium]|nr:DNA repair exonuclease [Candidatus Cacconaster stercorequi]
MVRILHAADFHLDSAFGALTEAQARQRRQESRTLVERMVDYANDHGVQLLLLAGDLFDSDDIYAQTGELLAQALRRFAGHAVIAPGNHDCCSSRSAYVRIRWPENVHIFTEDRSSQFDFPQYGCTVYGAAFTAPEASDCALPESLPEDGMVHLGVLHGDLGVKDSRYRSISPEQIAASGLDYLALGHIHSCSGIQRAGKTVYAYSGCLEGRGFDETGEKGFLLGDVAQGSAELTFVPFAQHRYELLEVDITHREITEAVTERLPEDTTADIYRIVLTGETDEPIRMGRLERDLEGRFFQLELRDQTRLRRDIWEKCGEDSLRGIFLQKLREKYDSADEDERATIEQAVRFGLAAMENREL